VACGDTGFVRRNDDVECCVDQFFACNYRSNPYTTTIVSPGNYLMLDDYDSSVYQPAMPCVDIVITAVDTSFSFLDCTFFLSGPLPNSKHPTYICPVLSSDPTAGTSYKVRRDKTCIGSKRPKIGHREIVCWSVRKRSVAGGRRGPL
jgi:hypothetical protein